jgi:uncharacterized membrane protein YidH (DUF202 family)
LMLGHFTHFGVEERKEVADLANEKGIILFLVPKADTRTSLVFLVFQFFADTLIAFGIQLDARLKHVHSETLTQTFRLSTSTKAYGMV